MTVGDLKQRLIDVPNDYEVVLNIYISGKGEMEAPAEGTAFVTTYKDGSSVGDRQRKVIIYHEDHEESK